MAPPGAWRGVDPARDVPVSLPVPDSGARPPFVRGPTRECEIHLERATRRPSLARHRVDDGDLRVLRPPERPHVRPARPFPSRRPSPGGYVGPGGDPVFARELIRWRIPLRRTRNARVRRVYTPLLGGEWG